MPANTPTDAPSAGQSKTPAGQLNVHDPNPPQPFRTPADEVKQLVTETDAGGLRLRRRPDRPPVVTVHDRYITGELDLRALELPYLLRFRRCRFAASPDLRQAKIVGIEFDGCWLPGLNAKNLRSDSDVALTNCTVAGNPVNFIDAAINGSLLLSNSRLHNPAGRALHADRLALGGALLAPKLRARGVLRVAGMRTGGNVSLAGAKLHNDTGLALNANGASIGGNLLCGVDQVSKTAFRANGLLFLASAKIASDFSLRGARLSPSAYRSPRVPHDDPNHDPVAVLVADRMHVDGNVAFDQGLTSAGTLRMVNAFVGGTFRLTGIEVDVSGGVVESAPASSDAVAPARRALHLDGTEVRGDINAQDAQLVGIVRMVDVSVRGSVHGTGVRLANPADDALQAQRIAVGGDVDLTGLRAGGSMLLQGAKIGTSLIVSDGRIEAPGRYVESGEPKASLDVRGATIGRDLRCVRLAAPGGVRMQETSAGRAVDFSDAELGQSHGGVALNAFGIDTKDLRLTFAHEPRGGIDLRRAHCAALYDNRNFWRATGKVELEDFSYDRLGVPVPLKDDRQIVTRLGWLVDATRDIYRPGPYDQFAAMLRESGNEEHAATVLIEKQRRRYRALARGFRVLGPSVLLWSLLQRTMVGYGYRPMRALVWLLGLLAFGTAWFAMHHDTCAVFNGVVNNNGTIDGAHCSLSGDEVRLVWDPFLYTLDLLVPIVDFGNKNVWHMSGIDQWISTVLIAMGWVLASSVAAGATRMLKRQ